MIILGVLYLIIHLVAVQADVYNLWGFSTWKFLPGFAGYIFLASGFLLLLPKVRKKIKPYVLKLADGFEKIPFIVWTLAFGLLLYLLSQAGFYLGDGILRIRNTEGGLLFSAAEPLDTFIHTLFYKVFNPSFGVSGKDSFQFLSILTGVATFAGSYLYLKKIFNFRNKRWLIGMLLLTAKLKQK